MNHLWYRSIYIYIFILHRRNVLFTICVRKVWISVRIGLFLVGILFFMDSSPVTLNHGNKCILPCLGRVRVHVYFSAKVHMNNIKNTMCTVYARWPLKYTYIYFPGVNVRVCVIHEQRIQARVLLTAYRSSKDAEGAYDILKRALMCQCCQLSRVSHSIIISSL